MAVQPDLPFFGSETGYQQWRDEIAAHRAELERQLGVPIGAKESVEKVRRFSLRARRVFWRGATTEHIRSDL